MFSLLIIIIIIGNCPLIHPHLNYCC